MEEYWKGRSVDLSLLFEALCKFFTDRGFTISEMIEEGMYVAVVTSKPSRGIAEEIYIHMKGEPDDFSIRFESGAHSRALVRYGTLLSLFGGGFLSKKGLKSQEELERLSKEFWTYADKKIWGLTGSSS